MKSMKYMGGGARKNKKKSKQAGGMSDEPTYAGSQVKGSYTKKITPRNPTAPTLKNEARLKSDKARLANKINNQSLQAAKEKAQAPGKAAKIGRRQAGGLMGGKGVIGAMGDLMKGKNAQDMKNNMKYRKGGMKKAQSSIDKLPESTAEEKAKKAKLMREDILRQQKAGSMKPMKPKTLDSYRDEKGNLNRGARIKMGQINANVGFREAELPKTKPVPPAKKSKATYAEAKANDPKLDQYIKARNNAEKGSAAYRAAQNKINAAYDRGPQRNVKAGTSEAMAKKAAPKSTVKPASERTIKTPTATAKPAAKKPTQTKAKAAPVKDSIVEDSKEIKFDGPSKRANRIEKKAGRIKNRKAKKAAIQSAKEKLKAARRS